ncbi:hypothetical protein Tsubulata_030564 [Turnera subulata]|uniref:DUF4283 domain-containing protein n=1 Tax=Turnera subulata TaxID=218843 RepID=A0A9Q0JC17_9ROSI|nr:hypothetical protein Tsubulata_030564 [Turnera subulata]
MAENELNRPTAGDQNESHDTLVIRLRPSRNKAPQPSLILVGRSWTERGFNRKALMQTMSSLWAVKRGLQVSELEKNLFMFRFGDARDKTKLLRSAKQPPFPKPLGPEVETVQPTHRNPATRPALQPTHPLTPICRRIANGEVVHERLNWFLMTPSWSALFPDYECRHLTREKSDHAPFCVKLSGTEEDERRTTRLFRFEAVWAGHEECESTISHAWNRVLPTFGDITGKLAPSGTHLQQWIDNNFGNIRRKLQSL